MRNFQATRVIADRRWKSVLIRGDPSTVRCRKGLIVSATGHTYELICHLTKSCWSVEWLQTDGRCLVNLRMIWPMFEHQCEGVKSSVAEASSTAGPVSGNVALALTSVHMRWMVSCRQVGRCRCPLQNSMWQPIERRLLCAPGLRLPE